MIPVGAQADVTVYGRINNAIQFSDPGGSADSTTDVSGIASRFGVKASSDLGNGLTAHGRYEFSTTTDKEGGGIDDTRIATVGISGGFGRVDVGNQWSSFYNTVGTDMDPTYWVAGISGSTPYRSSNTIKYSNSVGPLSLQADLRLNGKAEGADSAEGLRGDGGGIGLRVAVTDSFTLAAAYDTEDQSDEMTAATYGQQVTIAADSVDVLGLKLVEEAEDTGNTADEMIVKGLKRVGEDGNSYCVPDSHISVKAAKINAHNADDENTDVTQITTGDLNSRCMVSAASMGAETDRIGISAHMSMGQFWGKLG
ncbi:MAG: porin, partial [Gammaproteobacteria bacterium]|nr:porin [Gammaproteobacteria bacterium]